jgi:hypothetical protein
MNKPISLEITSKKSDRAFEVLGLVERLDEILKGKLNLSENENLQWKLTNDHPVDMTVPVGRGFYRTEVSIVRKGVEKPLVTAEINLVTSQDGRPHLEIFSDSVDDPAPLSIAEHLYECLAVVA